MATSPLAHESRDKIRDVLSGILRSAVHFQLFVKNPVEGIKLPPAKKGKRTKPFITRAEFDVLAQPIPEPYATMVTVAAYTGLRVSELVGVKWADIGEDTITIDERFCRGDWGAPKSEASKLQSPSTKL
jgi:integrase